MANTVSYHLPSLTPRGPGKAWVAEALKPWTAGDTSSASYLSSDWNQNFSLEIGKIYYIHQPIQKDNSEDEFDQPNIEFRRFYIRVLPDGSVHEIPRATADRLLREQAAVSTPKVVTPTNFSKSSGRLEAEVRGMSVVFSTSDGRSLSLPLTAKTAEALQELVGGNSLDAI